MTQLWRQPAWLPIQRKNALPRGASAPAAASSEAPERVVPPGRQIGTRPVLRTPSCRNLRERDDSDAAFGTPRSYRLCEGTRGLFLQTQAPLLWSLDGPSGPEFLRAAVGRGMVTVSTVDLSDNRSIVEADHALAVIGALRLRPGDDVWFVDAERRPPLLALIWQSGAPAVLLGGLALALLLWRAGVRFGPGVPTPAAARRSVAEQIRGTANFIFQRDSGALHRAQLRALEQAARKTIVDHDRLDRRSRAQAIGKATALKADDLARAMDPSLKRPRRELLATLTLLETATRRLSLNQ